MRKKLTGPIVLVRGAGEQASGVGWALAKAGYRVIMTEVEQPLMVRWPVCFGTAVREEQWTVEGLTSRRVTSVEKCKKIWENGEIPVLVDSELKCLSTLQPAVLVDGIMAKRNSGTHLHMAPLTIGLGPGFTAGEDIHLVIETNRGHNLGRIIKSGTAEPNTGIPGNIAGYTWERVIYSPCSGIFRTKQKIGEVVAIGDVLGLVEDETIHEEQVLSPIEGVLRGLLWTSTRVGRHVKIGDIDPRGKVEYSKTISEKARAIGAAVLLSILEQEQNEKVE
ncbi:selenium-dependent molybdenum cofactor biosynthesis protein YqeB [Desulfitobacterium sp.]|uniref:selenium-dependent molybdenum cofactor biosynthesis protein YqeB n=1 Tax=Desulfitobacterium sp. TaxID=49981 RepID=UPI002BED8AE1|nr:selenium-dependent molybdenum cofactor biosynthesis protein YqeB [Desulfitobacterium sp.]HVJ49187.1 selenium-dependent molybdenum cofactor biosynthesis protein YqeB [Desulfitobacterium sp.]